METRRRSRGKDGHRGRRSSEKVTWFDIYEDFKKNNPELVKDAPDFQPHSYATIKVFFIDGRRMTYNYDTKELVSICEKTR